MADELEQLVLSISADTRQIQRAMNRLVSDTGSSTRKMEQHFDNLGRKINSRFAGMAAELSRSFLTAFAAGFSIDAARALIDSSIRIQNALKVAGLEGKELKKVYDTLFESAQRNAVPLESLAQLYGRVSVAAKELGANSDRVARFTDTVAKALRASGSDAQSASGALLQLGQALGGSKIQAQEFNSMVDSLRPLLQAAASGLKEAGGSIGQLTALVKDGKVSSSAFFSAIEAGSSILDKQLAGAAMTTSQSFAVLQNSLVDAAGRFNTSAEAGRRLGEALQSLAAYIDQLSFGAMLQGLDAVADRLNSMIGLVNSWGEAFGRATGTENFGKWLAQTSFGQALGVQSPALLRERMAGDVPQSNAVVQAWARKNYGPNTTTEKTGRLPAVPQIKPVTLADYPVEGDKKAKGGRKGSTRATADDRFSEDLQSIRDRTAALKVEQETLNATFFEQQRRSVALDLEREALKQVRDEARRKGDQDWQNASLSKDQVRQINEVAEAYARQADELRKAQEAQDLQRDVLKGVLSDFRSAWADGKIDAQEWGDIVINVLDKIINKIEDDLVDAIMQTNSGGGSGDFLGSIFKLFGFGGGSSFNPTPNGFAQMLGLAGGGTVRGPGGPTGDQIPAMLSDGEHVTRAAMAKKYAPLLAAINADKLPHFAEGGFVSPQIMIPQMPTLATPAAPGPSLTFAPQFNVDASNAQPGVGREIEAALKRATKDMTPAVVAALREIKRMGIKV